MWVSVQNLVSNAFSKGGTRASLGADSKMREGVLEIHKMNLKNFIVPDRKCSKQIRRMMDD